MSTGTLGRWALEKATITLNNVAIAHGLTKCSWKKSGVFAKTLYTGNTPYEQLDLTKRTAEGDLNFVADKAVKYPNTDLVTNTLVITAPGFYFSGNVTISEVSGDSEVDLDKSAEISFKWNTIDGAFVLDNAAA